MAELEHSVANMFLAPAGLWTGSEVTPAGILSNMLWVSLGTIIRGAGGVGLAYRFAFGAGRA